MTRKLIVKGSPPRVDATVRIPLTVLEHIKDFNRCDVLVALQIAIHGCKGRPAPLASILASIGYQRRHVMSAISRMVAKHIVFRHSPGKYSFHPSVIGRTAPAKYWEAAALRGCTFQQIRVWAYVKTHEGMKCNRVQLGEHLNMRYPNLSRALNTQGKMGGERKGLGLVDLTVVSHIARGWYTPTGLPSSAPSTTETRDVSPPSTRARVSSTSSYLILQISRTTLPIKILSYLLRRAPHKDVAVKPVGVQAEPQKLALRKICTGGSNATDRRKISIKEVVTKYGREHIQSCIMKAGYRVGVLLREFKWTTRIAPRADALLKPFEGLPTPILYQAVQNALEHANYHLPNYCMPFRFLRKWLTNPRNIQKAADDMGMDLRTAMI